VNENPNLGNPNSCRTQSCGWGAQVVCFRVQKGQKREAELAKFAPHMAAFLKRLGPDLDKSHIFVIEQDSSQVGEGRTVITPHPALIYYGVPMDDN
jgi:hypothetical protein